MKNKSAARSNEHLELLYRLSQTFNSSLDLNEVLNRVMDEVITVISAERGFVVLLEAAGEMTVRAARGLDRRTIEEPQFQVSRSIVERVADEGAPVLTSDALSDARFSMRDSVSLLGLRSILCVPLRIRDKVTGVIYVDNRLQAGMFMEDDLELLTAIASSAAIAIENARLYLLAVEQARLERELQVAHDVQAGLLPRQVPQLPGWEFAVRWRPVREVAGDYYDFMLMDDGRLALVMADVTDKGMPAALFMALTRSTIRASLGRAPFPAGCIAHANRLITADSINSMFVTLFYALLNPATGEFTYVNAGHNPPLHFACLDAGGHQPGGLTPLVRTGMALGVLEDAEFEQRTLHLNRGDFILLYTDGLTDAMDAQGGSFGLSGVQSVLLQHGRASASEIVAALEVAVEGFTGHTSQFDDMAMMVVKYL